MNFSVEELLCMTAWTMAEPKAYGTFHLGFMLIGFAVCGFAAFMLRGIGERVNNRLLFICGAFLAISEAYKQLFYFYCIGDPGYDWDVLPFQLCSMPMYLCLIVTFLKNERLKLSAYSFMGFFNLLGGGISFFEPSGLLHSYWTLTLHSCLWHMMLVFIGLYLFFSGRAGCHIGDYKAAAKMFLVLCCAAFCINLLLRDISAGDVNMFFLGPTNNPIIVFSFIAEKLGWYTATAVYIPAVCIGAYIIFAVQKFLRERCLKGLQLHDA